MRNSCITIQYLALLSALLSLSRNAVRAAEDTDVYKLPTPVPPIEFSSGIQEFDDAFRLAMREMSENVENATLIAGAGWKQLWTRDTSYAVELAAGLVYPNLSKISLGKSVEQDDEFGTVWLQDECGHFGGWPNLSDAIVGARGAWSLYTITGDVEFLTWAYNVTRNSLARAERDVYDMKSGLFLGCSSFMESNSGYPEKYRKNGELVGKTKALSTNMLYYSGYKLGAKMAEQVSMPHKEIKELEEKAERLRYSIRSRLWLPHLGYYSYFEDENEILVPQMEGLGESLVLLNDGFEDERVASIFASTYRTKMGLPCLWPRFDHKANHISTNDTSLYYHNGRIWPFVESYWALAAARHGQVDIFTYELYTLAALSKPRQTFAEFYELSGSFPQERRRQLWSDAGYLAMIYQGLFGMTFLPDGIRFSPVKPASSFDKTFSLRRLPYRNMTLNVYVRGSGSKMISFILDGHNFAEPFVRGNLQGIHQIVITLGNVESDKGDALVLLVSLFVAILFVAVMVIKRRHYVLRRFGKRRSTVDCDRGHVGEEAESLLVTDSITTPQLRTSPFKLEVY